MLTKSPQAYMVMACSERMKLSSFRMSRSWPLSRFSHGLSLVRLSCIRFVCTRLVAVSSLAMPATLVGYVLVYGSVLSMFHIYLLLLIYSSLACIYAPLSFQRRLGARCLVLSLSIRVPITQVHAVTHHSIRRLQDYKLKKVPTDLTPHY